MDKDIQHEIRNAHTSMAGIRKEQLKLIREFDKRMAKLSKDYIIEVYRLEEAMKCLNSVNSQKEN